jgi:carbon monoxide dehydrogenase subunit G
MEFSGTFELEGASAEEVWRGLSDPVMIREALPGCQFLTQVDGDGDVDFDALREQAGSEGEPTLDPDVVAERAFEDGGRYAALVEIGVGSIKPAFETVVTIDERAFPEMSASGEGEAGDSSFEMDSWMHLEERDDGTGVDWSTEADVFGRIANMGQRMINPVANRVVKRFFDRVEEQLNAAAAAEDEAAEDEAVESGASGDEETADEAMADEGAGHDAVGDDGGEDEGTVATGGVDGTDAADATDAIDEPSATGGSGAPGSDAADAAGATSAAAGEDAGRATGASEGSGRRSESTNTNGSERSTGLAARLKQMIGIR